MQFVRPGDAGSMERLLRSKAAAEVTYAETGATLAGIRPSGYHSGHYAIALGRGEEAFGRGVDGLKVWRAHRSGMVRVFPEGAEVGLGTTVVVTLGLPSLSLAAPCRVVGLVDEPGRWGFAYGTLPGHPETGEESFVVSLSASGEVRFEVTSFSRPGSALVRLSGPIGRGMQSIGAQGYLRNLRRFVTHGE